MKLFLHLLMLALFYAASARVVKNFEHDCGQFFANEKSPTRLTGSQYKQICQTMNGVPYYATFYDTNNKIPVYSAYRFKGQIKCQGPSTWFIEPQLDDANGQPNMSTESSVDKSVCGIHQALSDDYVKTGYDRGHLAPVYQAGSPSCAKATFTLTNAAPQNKNFNRGQWRVLEKNISNYLDTQCLLKGYAAYIVTGVVPGTYKLNNRVNVPSYFWTAYCCLENKNPKCAYWNGAIGPNDNNVNIAKMSVDKLEGMLSNFYGTKFNLFPNNKNRQSIFK